MCTQAAGAFRCKECLYSVVDWWRPVSIPLFIVRAVHVERVEAITLKKRHILLGKWPIDVLNGI